ncbi:MAG: hypothetical protein LBS85_07850 [Clostridiales Family XIII bacterium]|jgi:hypothetical protein|nr:hypothetical protein [Clostridiales Family XIII bacterium]
MEHIDEGGLYCARCAVPLARIETKFSYLGHDFKHPVLKCPVCGQLYLPEDFVDSKIFEVETLLEDK